MLKLIKKISPESGRTYLRKVRAALYRIADGFLPEMAKREYLGYALCYTPGAGLVDRIRLGSMATVYEPEVVDAITEILAPIKEPVLIDIGTNIGLISLACLRENPSLKIFGFEPSPVPYACFAATIAENGLEKNIDLRQLAISNATEPISFAVHSSRDSSGDGILDTGRSSSSATAISVECTTLDRWWEGEGRPKVHVIKIDIEGAELWALQGAVALLAQAKPAIILEISHANLKSYPHGPHDILRFFEGCGYGLKALDGTIATEGTIDSLVSSFDTFVAMPR